MAYAVSMGKLTSVKPMATTHIIIVNYNAGDWLTTAVLSALEHSEGDVTVVDNASSDSSVSAVKRHVPASTRLHWLLNSTNRGFAAANNQVLGELQADYAVLMNPDSEINADTLPLILEAFACGPELGLVSCQIRSVDGTLQGTSRRRFPTPWSALVRLLRLHQIFPNDSRFANFDYGDSDLNDQGIEYVEAVSGAFMVARKSAIEDVGLLDEAYFMHCEDLDWCKRFALRGWQVGFVAAASVVHAKGVSSESRPLAVLWTLHRGMSRFFDKFYNDQYNFLVRVLVKFGISVSFIARSFSSLAKVGYRCLSSKRARLPNNPSVK